MAKENRERSVQILAVNQKYKERPYFLTPIYITKKKRYILGIEDLAPVEQGKIKKALGIKTDSNKDGVPINEFQVPIHHRMSLHLASNEDYGIYRMALTDELVAHSSRVVAGSKHLFFINDVQKEAVETVSNEKLQFEAKKLIFEEGDVQKLKSLCIYIGGIDIRNMPLNVLTSKSLEAAGRVPDKVLEFYQDKVANRVMIMELDHYGLIRLNKGKYYDGEVYLGTLEEAINFIADPKNSQTVNSLGKRLLEKKGE